MPVRKIIKKPQYEEAVEQILKKFGISIDMFTGAEWSLCRTPEQDGVFNQEIGVWQATIVSVEKTDFPPHRILYAFDDRELRLLTVIPRSPS